ncbi:MAG: cytidine deaminase [Eubacteriales bacterium]
MTDKELVFSAEAAMKNAYAPYSDFFVGAALLCEDGSVYTGCNIENAAFSPTCCAERTAVFKAVSEGKRRFSAIAVVGGKNGEINGFCPPCGVCRQVLSEFAGKDMRVILYDGKKTESFTMEQLLPLGFSSEKLK